MRCLISLAIFALLGAGFPATAASFDCGKALTVQEKAICADSKLSQLDEDTAAAYTRLRAQLTPAGAAKVQQDQREWLAWLQQTCPDRNDPQRLHLCLSEAYSTRFYLLRSGLKRAGGITFFPRLKVVTTPDKEQRRSLSDPGFGIGWFSWPEIDQPTPRQASWNAAVRQEAIGMALDPDDKRQQPADFDPSSVADADVTIVYRLRAANEQFISVGLENGSYRHGMPHSNVETISFEWWSNGDVL